MADIVERMRQRRTCYASPASAAVHFHLKKSRQLHFCLKPGFTGLNAVHIFRSSLLAGFDKTIVSIPTWRLMSESFKNWRGMQQSGGRRIKRSLFIDASGVRFIRDDEEQKLSQVHLLTDYIGRKQAELKAWNAAQGNVAAMSANRRRMTNIGTFRAYALAYLKSHPEIQPGMTCMVRQMQTTAQGIPLEIYCFTSTTAWADYERIQGDIFDYLLAVLPEFGLSLYQQPSGGDLRAGLLPAMLGASHIPEAEKHIM
jgi:miniconductance mechanosensitive channel